VRSRALASCAPVIFTLALTVGDPEVLLRKGERLLNAALADYEATPTSRLAREFHELRMQAAIFHFDVCYEVVSLWRNEPVDLAEKVALKNIIHKLYEYEQVLGQRLTTRILALARARRIYVDGAFVKTERQKWKAQLKKLRSWSDIRNQTAGHYGSDIPRQIELLKQIDRQEVTNVVAAFLSFNISVLRVLRDAGRGEI
jgi:hypothetical protein